MRKSAIKRHVKAIACVLFLIFILVGLSAHFESTTVLAADFKQPKALEPEIEAASGEAEEFMAGIRIPEGWNIQLFAAEPDVANVVALDVDNRGRVFVCETFRQDRGVTDNRGHDEKWLLADLSAETVQDRIDYHKRLLGEGAVTYAQHDDRIRRVEDSDGDGKADRSYVLASGFNRIEEGTGAGVLARGDDVYYTCIPKLWKLSDKDDDGIADQRVALSDGYGVRVAFRGHDMHGLVIGPDGRLYFTIGDRGYHITTEDGRVLADPASGAVFRCELDGSKLEVFATGLRNPQELAFNDVGDLFSVDNNSDSGDMARIVQILEGGDTGWRMHYQYLPDRGPFNREKIWKPFHQEQPAYIVPPIANFTDGPSGLAYYPGTGFGDQLNDTFLICDFRGGPANSGVRSFKLEADGAFYSLAQDSDPIWTVLPTDVMFGPDGAIYLSDWVNGWNGLGKGRIYRITDPKHSDTAIVKEVQSLLAGDWSARASDKLLEDLGHVDRRIRFEAQWELAKRSDLDALLGVVQSEADQRSRLHALWGAEQVGRSYAEKTDVFLKANRKLFKDPDAVIRATAAKFAGQHKDKKSAGPLREHLADESVRVRYHAAISLGKLKDGDSLGVVVNLLKENKNLDPAIRHAGVMYLAGLGDPGPTSDLVVHKSESVRRAAVVALRRLRSGAVSEFLKDESALVVAEAARAIHDTPIPVGMKSLAAMIEKTRPKNGHAEDGNTEDENLVRRILNANYRLGTKEAAERIASYATRVSASSPMRIEALEMLADWSQPDPRDRVLNVYRPLEAREAKDASSALAPHIESLMASEDELKEKTIEVASSLGISKIIPMLVNRIEDQELSAQLRATSLQALSHLDHKKAVSLARTVKMLPATELLPTALNVLASYDAGNSLPKFIEGTQSRNMEARQISWDILAKQNDPTALATIVAGVESYLDGSLSGDVHLNVMEAAEGKLDETLQKSLLEHGKALSRKDPLANFLVATEGGDKEKGKEIFFERTQLSCVRCHKVDRAGGEVGPNLTKIGSEKDRRYLLESICLPDAQIAKGFETAIIVNDSGQVFTGIVKTDNDDFVELIQNDGSQIRIPGEEIVGKKNGKSSMPNDLAKQITLRELRDLVAYLASLKKDSRTDDDIE